MKIEEFLAEACNFGTLLALDKLDQKTLNRLLETRKCGMLPISDVGVGRFGFILFGHDSVTQEEVNFPLLHQVFPVPDVVKCDAQNFKEAYEQAQQKNYLIMPALDPKGLMYGFVVIKGDGPVWFKCHVSDLRSSQLFEELDLGQKDQVGSASD